MTRRRKTAKSPQEIAAELEAAKARKRAVAELRRQPDLVVKATENHHIISIRRLDVFSLLFDRKSLTIEQYQAVRRLEHVQALSLGQERPEQTFDRVDTTSKGQNITGAMIQAGADVNVILATCGPVSGRLLEALTEAQSAVLTRWRDVVERVTGETRPECQTAAVRSACANLAEAWVQFDYRKRAA